MEEHTNKDDASSRSTRGGPLPPLRLQTNSSIPLPPLSTSSCLSFQRFRNEAPLPSRKHPRQPLFRISQSTLTVPRLGDSSFCLLAGSYPGAEEIDIHIRALTRSAWQPCRNFSLRPPLITVQLFEINRLSGSRPISTAVMGAEMVR